MVVIAVLAAIAVGFLTGLLTFRRASHWCPVCGLTLTCPQPEHRQAIRPQAKR
jgi:hypothetical protein